MTASNEVFFPLQSDYDTWKKDVNDYATTKKKFQGMPERQTYLTEKEYKRVETLYNPITQKYTDPNVETVARQTEESNFINTLAKNKDNALRYEQTYNVINFENKLAGLEHRPDYPKEKPWYFRPDRDSLVDYNIITGYSL